MFESLVPRSLVAFERKQPSRSRSSRRGQWRPARGQFRRAESLEARCFLAADPIVTVDTNFGDFKLELFASAAPQTVANFLTYVDSGAFNNSIFQRNATSDGTAAGSPFVLQGGGYTTSSDTFASGSQLTAITPGATVPGEANADNPNNPNINTTGTIAMALSNGPDSATNEWFINLADNPQLDDTSDGGPFTVFGQVIDNGMTTVIDPTVAQLTGGNNLGYPSENPPVGPNNQLVVISSMTVDSIDGTVFTDTNGDGTMDSGETGIAGRTVFLNEDGTGVPDANNPSTTTDANGNYSFSGLAAGPYTVEEVLAGGVTLTTPITQTVTVAADQTASGVNFGENPVVDPAITAEGAMLTATQNTAFTGAVATFTDANTGADAGAFTATIDWGDGGSSTGTVTGSAGTFTVNGSHVYAAIGTDTVNVTVSDVSPGTATATATSTAQVVSTPLSVVAVNVNATQGLAVSNVSVATFTDADTSDTADGFTATVNWGDGGSSTGTVTGSAGTFTVAATHTYDNYGDFTIGVQVVDTQSIPAVTAIATSSAAVADTNTLTAAGTAIAATATETFSGTVATFNDTYTGADAGAFTATIEWGDGGSSTGTVTGSSGTFTVNGSHVYAAIGTDTVSVTVSDVSPGTATAAAASTAQVVSSPLSVVAVNVNATQGLAASNVSVATFTDADTSDTADGFTATVNWGDGGSSTGTVTGSAGTFTVAATHTYDNYGDFTIGVQVVDTQSVPTVTAGATSSAAVADANTLTAVGTAIAATATETFNGVVATFNDTYSGADAGAFTATIDWGDGDSSIGTVTGSAGTFTVNGSHVYSAIGTDTVNVTVSDVSPGTATATATSTAQVVSSPLSVVAVSVNATQGTVVSNVSVATFTDANTSDTADEFTATVNWGDGGSSTGTVTGSAGTFTVAATHTYDDYGDFTISVQVVDTQSVPTVTAGATSSAAIADANTLTAVGTAIAATATETFSGTVATFNDTYTGADAGAFTATIEWGDGGSSTGTVTGSAGTFTVNGSHVYAAIGTDTVSVTVSDVSPGTASATAASTAQVVSSPLSVVAVNVNATQGTAVSNVSVATFTDANTSDTAEEFTATVNWGDGGSSTGTVTGSAGTFTVAATHTYDDYGDFTISVQVADTQSVPAVTAGATSSAAVADANTLTAVGTSIAATATERFNGVVATFNDAYSGADAGAFTATIDWGDGDSSTGTVTGSAGTFAVSGSHTYNEDGALSVQITLTDSAPGTATATAFSIADVANTGLTISAVSVSAVEGQTFSGTMATFTDASTGDTAAQFTATIDWGDGGSSTGTVTGSGGTFTVAASHAYVSSGDFSISIQVDDTQSIPPVTATAITSATVSGTGTGLTISALSVSAVEGQTFSGTIATFTDASTGDTAAEFTATIDWGDGGSSTGTVTGSAGTFTVAASHAYGDYGDFTISVQVDDEQSVPAVTATATTSATIADANTLTAVGSTIAATATETFSGTVATFTDSYTGASAAVFTATINWGDGNSSTGTVTGSDGTFTVSGSHLYSAAGIDVVSVTISDVSPGTATATTSSTAQVAGSPLSATAVNVNVTQGLTASGVVVATFADANTSDTAAQFTATIDWGDGSSSPGTVTGGDGLFTVTASHTYAEPGHDDMTVTILDSAGPTATANPTAVIGSADERFIGELYRILLGREADSAGFAYWDNLMSGGTTEAQVIQGFETSPEFELGMGNELYERYLQRTMDAASVTAVTTALSTGTFEQEAEAIVSSDEFFSDSGGTADGWLTALYTDALNRAIDATALPTYGAMDLTDPTVRAQVATEIFGGSEYQTDLINSPSTTAQTYNQGVPTGFYQMYLNRAADSAGLAAAQAQFAAGQTDLQVMAAILASDEFFGNL